MQLQIQGSRYAQIRKVWEGAEILRDNGSLPSALNLYQDAYQKCEDRLVMLAIQPSELTNAEIQNLNRLGIALPQPARLTDAEINEQTEVQSLKGSVEERVSDILKTQPGLIGRISIPSLLTAGNVEEAQKGIVKYQPTLG